MDEARNIFEKALLVNNNYSSSHFHFALSLEDFKQFDSAIFHYNQAIKINPSFYQAYENRAFFQIQIQIKSIDNLVYCII
ncbi:unnamed protein product [Paramecium sonneborni]|nr:unnamed protein product [Paramecium sonneborni]